MGNCTVKGTTLSCTADRAAAVAAYRAAVRVRVVTETGGVIDLQGPVEVGIFLAGFPRHGIFRPGDASSPLLHHEQLQNGRLYYLLPLDRPRAAWRTRSMRETVPEPSAATESPATCERPRNLEVLPQQMDGVWRVKLAIGAETLATMLSVGGGGTEALIERMRTLASSVEATPAQARKARPGGAACKSPVVHYLERS
ncbi:unnamed protein product [Spirodela intermedia]|uniref:Uncharacterized protein n=1 Tax=Spirodela intermedia TaxID=51605 RepID=A0A7I8KYA2_SPIIN|nr:unnamed protein product [Spirodela intermedia]